MVKSQLNALTKPKKRTTVKESISKSSFKTASTTSAPVVNTNIFETLSRMEYSSGSDLAPEGGMTEKKKGSSQFVSFTQPVKLQSVAGPSRAAPGYQVKGSSGYSN